jgi:tripartite-type tricarboxylate transporter receptor subunit TctC
MTVKQTLCRRTIDRIFNRCSTLAARTSLNHPVPSRAQQCLRLLLLCIWPLLGAPGSALAQDFPTRPIVVIVPSGPGGIDTVVRVIVPELEKRLGQPIIIENKPGANGNIAIQSLVRAKPDGYTLMFATISILTVNPFVYKDLHYDSVNDFEAVARHVMLPLVWTANPEKGFNSLQDVIAYAQKNPGKLTMGFPGIGSFPHLLEEAFMRKNDIKALLVPFRSAPESDMGAVSGVVDISVDNMSTMTGLVRSKKLTALAVTSQTRARHLPDVPSWMEDGTGPFPATAWYAFIAPKGTPAPIVERLNTSINEAIQAPAPWKVLEGLGAEFSPMSSEQLKAFIAEELKRYGQIVREAGIQPQ